MKYSSFVIEHALFMADCGMSVSDICSCLKISDTTFYNWKTKFHGLNAAGIDLFLQLEQEKRVLKRQVEKLRLDKQALQSLVTETYSDVPKQDLVQTLWATQPITKQRARTLLLVK